MVLGSIYSYVWQSCIFWKNSPSGKNDQKMVKMIQRHGFWTFLKNNHISFVWNLCKMEVLMVNIQKLINRLISDFDFWHVDRHVWKKQGSLTGFLKKNSHLGEWIILSPNIAHPHNSGSAGRSFLEFYAIKGANRKMIMILIIFQKKKLFGANGPFWAQKWHILITLDLL